MEKWTKRAVELVARYAILGESTPSVIEYTPSKTEITPACTDKLPRVAPESVGVSGGRIAAMLKELEEEAGLNLHNVIVVKDMKVISSASRPGYSTDIPHLSNSMSKVLVSIATGYLITEGRLSLDDSILDLITEYTPTDKRFSEITVRHLLSMTSGVSFSEAGVITELEWTKAFFESPLRFTPGERFAYNSMNTYILAVIIKRTLGMGVGDLLRERLLSPLGIKDFFWEKGPEGIEKGGFGAYMSLESWAKIASVFLAGGKYRGATLIPEPWVEALTSPQAKAPDNKGGYDYGYTVWTSPERGSFLFSGMLGQLVYMSRVNNIAVAVNAGNDELFFTSATLRIIEKYLSEPLPSEADDPYRGLSASLAGAEADFFKNGSFVTPLPRQKGILYRIGLRYREPYPTAWNGLLHRFTLPTNNASILPILTRTMQNNFPSSLEEIGFSREGRRIFLICRDGGEDYKLEVGFYRYAEGAINIGGELYRVRALGAVSEEEGEKVYKIELVFPEIPSSRRIEIRQNSRDVISVRLTEAPGRGLVGSYLTDALAANPRMRFVADILEGRLGRGYLGRKAASLFDRSLNAVRRGTVNYAELMERERENAPRPTPEERSVASLIFRYVGSGEKAEGSLLGDLLGTVLGSLRRRGE